MTTTVTHDELVALCTRALRAAGEEAEAAGVLARAVVDAEQAGNRAVGVTHLFDYLDAYRDGRIIPGAVPEVTRAAPSCLVADAHHGLAQVAFEAAAPNLFAAVETSGVAALWIRRSYTCGELGHYARRAAEHGLAAVACANSPALMSLGGSGSAVLGTNPLAYAFPRSGEPPLVIDQASSQTAYVNLKQAAKAGEPIPAGWAVGSDGTETTDAAAAVAGALLPFGGHRGGNIALLVELLATLAGGSFSLDAPPFDGGTRPPGIGVFILCLNPAAFTGAPDRAAAHLRRLRDEHAVHLPALESPAPSAVIGLAPETARRLRTAADAQ
ncbi:Ldh family oxidoreductase [Streptomyces sp. LHD-70]|uniref:Ldh family oxidoreductase n=1 Tax=Streptomyces sp. LHD-70 TaxID=3072140 RepID=UPI00280C708D|nr:Ldh family oxidoreductase [Streptomyces sp. LHD-70]MDQ8704086.1 Ldh family oxidoreductase [Streptomyces sp. LHD-70]